MPKKRLNPDLQPNLISEPQTDYTISPEQLAEKETYHQRLAEFLKEPASRQIEGFPIGENEDILALSDPPYYTACPNPFMGEIIEKWQQERNQIRTELGLPNDSQVNEVQIYHRKPFAADVSEGKNDPIYNVHSFHTKVPHKAIMRYIMHYTDPGDIVFDGFCGTGMTGVAAQLCGNKKAVQELGYRVDNKGVVWDGDLALSHMGIRNAVLLDLSPAATFITYNINNRVNPRNFERDVNRIISEVEQECGWMYETWHPNCDDPNRVKGRINYIIWSEVFVCPTCGQEMVFWDLAVDQETGSVRGSWECPGCSTLLAKSPQKNTGVLKAERAWGTHYDRELKKTIRQVKHVPVLINYSIGKKRFEKHPDKADIALINKIDDSEIQYHVPTNKIPDGEKTSDPLNVGITHVHHFYTRRNLIVFSTFIEKSKKNLPVLFLLSSIHLHINKMRLYQPSKPGGTPGLHGTLYVSAIPIELSIFDVLSRKIKDIHLLFQQHFLHNLCSTNSSSEITSPGNRADYIFVDPPFGSNLMYSELNLLWEAWLKVCTNNKTEAIINKEQHKGLNEYQILMENSFNEFYRLLKPGHWMTVEFHNSQNSVWNAIQEAILKAGFMVADVRIFDKQQGSYNQKMSTGAVKQDLVISAYKPTQAFEQQFLVENASTQGAWSFIRQHLDQLPLPTVENSTVEILSERQAYLLYDRLVAFHLVRGLTLPLSASEFYQGLTQRFLDRDGMYFTPAQAAEYDKLRLQADRVEQLALFVTDEKSALQWLRQSLDPALGGQPQTYQDIQPKFIQQLHQERHEKLPELREILEENFLRDETECWYAPDPEHQADLEKLRERLLLREFTEYRKSKGKLRIFRSEAVRAGFSQAWRERDYSTILEVAERLPEQVLQEDPALKMYYDNALHRADRQPKQDPLF